MKHSSKVKRSDRPYVPSVGSAAEFRNRMKKYAKEVAQTPKSR